MNLMCSLIIKPFLSQKKSHRESHHTNLQRDTNNAWTKSYLGRINTIIEEILPTENNL